MNMIKPNSPSIVEKLFGFCDDFSHHIKPVDAAVQREVALVPVDENAIIMSNYVESCRIMTSVVSNRIRRFIGT